MSTPLLVSLAFLILGLVVYLVTPDGKIAELGKWAAVIGLLGLFLVLSGLRL